ncbi:metal ABC transporter ATP-binding protein [Thermodesulfovibrio sp.]|uniref:metal ABC transporter ATP-binding protein n=1 Tax=Thermodesulfovibrio sp. TaxID=2067987 RepID=UPI0030B11D9C
MTDEKLKILNSKKIPLIDISHVTYSTNGVTILEDINFQVEEGCYLGIVGPNGAGKTTLLRLILGLIKPKTGKILIKGFEPEAYIKNEPIGYLPQRISQNIYEMPLTVEELVRSGTEKSDRDTVEWAMSLFKIEHLHKKPLRELSGGERQKAFLARAVVVKPRILLLDEPTTGIDPHSRDDLLDILERLNRDFGVSILVVTHDIATFTHESKCLLCLNKRMVCLGEPQKLLKEEYMKMLYPSYVSFPHKR